ncbi:hypothetical protein [Fusobacterium sp.]|uniref:hypothetical protein n=1 Tax=Fusobacterium sp. TaxID=68766 RepID=UPI0025C1E63A|nr:hypothetical protein [Fusobacterium sp.]
MAKYFYRMILFIFLIFGGLNVQAAPAPANITIGTQATLTFMDTTNKEQVVLSNIVTVTVNPVKAVTISPSIISSAFPGERIAFPVKITNASNIDTSISVYLANGDDLVDLAFIIDENGNGVLEDNETTAIPESTMTPIVKAEESISLIVTGQVPTGAVANTVEKYIVHARILDDEDIVVWNTNEFTIKSYANVKIVKSIGETAIPDAYVYVFKITNESNTPATNLTLTDTLPSNIVLDKNMGVWFPVGSSVGKEVPITATGYEDNSDDIDFSVVNGVLTLKVKNMIANHTGNDAGGVLHLRVRPKDGELGGTIISNTASYTYDNGVGAMVTKDTNTASYTIPVKRAVTIANDLSETFARQALFAIPQTIENIGNIKDTYTLSIEDGIYIENPVFYLDTNGDGIKQDSENVVVTETPELNPGEKYNVILTGRWLQATSTSVFKVLATSKADTSVSDLSSITVSSFNVGVALILNSDLTMNATSGREVVIPQTLENKMGNVDKFRLTVEEVGDIFASVKYIVDTNGDGIRQASETTEITGLTPDIANGDLFKFFVVGSLKPEITGTETFRIYARSIGSVTGVDWSVITLNIEQPVANVKVEKSLGDTAVPDAFVYVFKITNDSDVIGKDLVITDNLPNNISPDLTTGVWYPFGWTTSKSIPLTATGYEAISDDVDLSIVNGVMTFKAKQVPAGAGITNTKGGMLVIRFKPNADVAPGTVISNTASYVYNNGKEVVPSANTETVLYTVPEKANIKVEKSILDIDDSNSFIYRFRITNDANIPATNIVITDNLSSDIEVDATVADWTPFNWTTSKALPLTDTGYEVVSDEINVSVINNVLSVKLKQAPAGGGVNTTGGILLLRVKAKESTAPGTVVSNTASYSYNNGIVDIPAVNTNTVTYTIPTATLGIEKYQAVDGNKDNTPDSEYTKDALTVNPGDTIFYKLVIQNTGNGSARNIVVADKIADYTTMFHGDGSATMTGKPVWRTNGGSFVEIEGVPEVGASGSVTLNIPVINAGDNIEIYYNVKVDE